jgi:starvation-inducible DNA-binding protein
MPVRREASSHIGSSQSRPAAGPEWEWTNMTRNIELTAQARQESAGALSKVLSDTFVLYLKTHNFHWNVEGPQFLGLHEKFEEQYRDLWSSIDEIAERIRALGQPAPGTTGKFRKLAEIAENERIPSALEMIRELVNDHETAVRTVRAALSTAQAAGDEATAGLLADRLTYHEKELWMMRSMLGT